MGSIPRHLRFDTRGRIDRGIPGGVIAFAIVMMILSAISDSRSACYIETPIHIEAQP